jgi:hypothetical protein
MFASEIIEARVSTNFFCATKTSVFFFVMSESSERLHLQYPDTRVPP